MKNLNFDFLLDIWADLKAKKLAPVAIGLVVAAIAIPALLTKGEESGQRGPAADPRLEHVRRTPGRGRRGARGSRLEARLLQGARSLQGQGEARRRLGHRHGHGHPFPSTGGGEPEKGSSGGTGSPLGGLGSGGSTGSSGPSGRRRPGQHPDADPHDPPQLDIPSRSGASTRSSWLSTSAVPGASSTTRRSSRMTFLPRPTLPALLFMGVPEGERAAIFFVYPGMTHQGEGKCMPSPKNCNFLHLADRPGALPGRERPRVPDRAAQGQARAAEHGEEAARRGPQGLAAPPLPRR